MEYFKLLYTKNEKKFLIVYGTSSQSIFTNKIRIVPFTNS